MTLISLFGKILLGAGGLVRAYTKSVTNCLEDHIVTLEKAYETKLSFPYSLLKRIDYILQKEKMKYLLSIIDKNTKISIE